VGGNDEFFDNRPQINMDHNCDSGFDYLSPDEIMLKQPQPGIKNNLTRKSYRFGIGIHTQLWCKEGNNLR
jgi:hypothetical protein